MTSEQLGQRIGVSGATVRRWETGRSHPSFADISAIANVCDLAATETALSTSSLSGQGRRRPSSQRRSASNAPLNSSKPLTIPRFSHGQLHVRSRPQYLHRGNTGLNRNAGQGTSPNPILAGPGAGGRTAEELAAREAVLDRWLRDFWYWSAFQCGNQAFVRLIRSFAKHEGFRERWRAMGSSLRPDADELIGRVPTDIPAAFRHLPHHPRTNILATSVHHHRGSSHGRYSDCKDAIHPGYTA